jgi:tetratricopeptide (TPR) repeat protein
VTCALHHGGFAQSSSIESGRQALLRGDAESAIGHFEGLVAQQPKDADAHFWLGNAYSAKAEQAGMLQAARFGGKARDAWERAVVLNPRHGEARLRLTEYFALVPGIMGGSFDKAQQHAKALMDVDSVLGHRAMAVVQVQKKDLAGARREYHEALKAAPASSMAHMYFGMFLASAEKNFTASFEAFEAGIKAEPAYLPTYYQLGRVCASSGLNLRRGEEVLRKYLSYSPKGNEPALGHAHLHLGTLLEKAGRVPEARASYQAALKLNPSLKRAAEALGRLPQG